MKKLFEIWLPCSLIGASIISIGFYTVMWGKAKEEEMGDEEGHTHNLTANMESHEDQKVPLLGTYKTQRYSSDHV